jgi:uridylate kinase
MARMYVMNIVNFENGGIVRVGQNVIEHLKSEVTLIFTGSTTSPLFTTNYYKAVAHA